MNFEQIIIRLGVDASAVQSGLGRVGAYVKGWSASLMHHIKGSVGAFLGVGVALNGLEKMKEKILEIANLSRETGANTNFIQSMMQESEKVGIKFENMTGGIARFNKMLGAAKMGNTLAVKTLADMHIITDKNSVSSLNFTGAIHKLAVRFDELNDKQKQAYLLSQAFGRSYHDLFPLFEQGADTVEKMSHGNFFTKMSGGAIKDFGDVWRGTKSAAIVLGATAVNILDLIPRGVARISQGLGVLSRNPKMTSEQYLKEVEAVNAEEEKHTFEKQLQIAAEKDGLSVQGEKNKLLIEENQLKEKSAELSARISDRDKLSVDEMAARARKLTGNRDPLEAFHTVTPRMRTALGIKNLEQSARVQFLLGNDQKRDALQSEADRLRAANPWMMRMDVKPMEKTEKSLDDINRKLDDVVRVTAYIKD